MSGEPLRELKVVPVELRVAHLLRIDSFLDWAVLSMWAVTQRAAVVMGMAAASLRHPGPGGPEGPDEEFIARIRDLVAEAREYYAADDFPAAMARMRVAHDLVAMRIIALAEE